jgi:predicted nucleic acid-binding Zn ribbon protein
MPLDPINRLMQQFEQQPRWRSRGQFRRVQQNWSQIVGPAVACHARPVRLERQMLYVAVANPMWGQTLTLERTTILKKLEQQFQIELKDIRFSSGDWYRRARSQPQDIEIEQTLAIPRWLQNHPSFDPVNVSKSPEPAPETAVESFQRWATLSQTLAKTQPLCPACRCPCPEGELRRWSVCSVCAAQKF